MTVVRPPMRKQIFLDCDGVLVDDRDRRRRLWEANGGVFVHHMSAARSVAELRARGYLD